MSKTITFIKHLLKGVDGSGSNTAGSDITIQSGAGTGTAGSGDIYFKTAPASGIPSATLNTATEKMRLTKEGYLGIGTEPTSGFLHVNGTITTSLTARYYAENGSSNTQTADRPLSAYFNSHIACSELQVHSDERIKENIEEVDDTSSLQKLRDINLVSYNYKDRLKKGDGRVVGFIAQQVKEHLPEAINEIKDIIPNEMRVLDDISWNGTKMSSVSLNSVSGVKYRFYVSNEADASDEVMKEVVGNEDNTFTFDQQWTNVFCYGKEVGDFHTLDKQKLFALNFSATQELDRQFQVEKDKVATLETDLTTEKAKTATLESQVADLIARVTALENP